MSEAICLGIETSCDETAAGLLEGRTTVLSSIVSSQYVHSRYGGVVPELAARAHARLIVPVTRAALEAAGRSWRELSCVAATCAPGLLGALLTGLPFARSLSFALGIPFVGVNHLEGHIFAARLEYPDLAPPFLAAVLSGGHTELLRVSDWCSYEMLGSTMDDACGEAFDKVAKLLGLPYPGGAMVERLAREGTCAIRFPSPAVDAGPRAGSLDFSFSGLKTAVLYHLRAHPEACRADVAASFQDAALAGVEKRIAQAVKSSGLRRVAVSGGVAANGALRARLADSARSGGFAVFVPRPEYCTDNAVMIAAAGVERLARFGPSRLDVPALARAPLIS